jgi:hypothetical protein
LLLLLLTQIIDEDEFFGLIRPLQCQGQFGSQIVGSTSNEHDGIRRQKIIVRWWLMLLQRTCQKKGQAPNQHCYNTEMIVAAAASHHHHLEYVFDNISE